MNVRGLPLIAGVAFTLLVNTALAAESRDQLSQAEVAKFLAPGAFWCFEPIASTCGFTAEVTEFDGTIASYTVSQRLDANAVLVQHIHGTLKADGQICEQDADYHDEVEVTDLRGNSLGPDVARQVRQTLMDASAEDPVIEHCFSYERAAGDADLFTQFHFEDGVDASDSDTFVMDYRTDARKFHSLRAPPGLETRA